MEVVFHGQVEMLKAWYQTREIREEAKKQMEYGGWTIYNEHFNEDDKIVVTFIRPTKTNNE